MKLFEIGAWTAQLEDVREHAGRDQFGAYSNRGAKYPVVGIHAGLMKVSCLWTPQHDYLQIFLEATACCGGRPSTEPGRLYCDGCDRTLPEGASSVYYYGAQHGRQGVVRRAGVEAWCSEANPIDAVLMALDLDLVLNHLLDNVLGGLNLGEA